MKKNRSHRRDTARQDDRGKRVLVPTLKRTNDVRISLLSLLLLLLPACGGDQAAQWLETAQLEERQNNVAHATQLYEDIVRLYPDSQAATTARARLDALLPRPPSEGEERAGR